MSDLTHLLDAGDAMDFTPFLTWMDTETTRAAKSAKWIKRHPGETFAQRKAWAVACIKDHIWMRCSEPVAV